MDQGKAQQLVFKPNNLHTKLCSFGLDHFRFKRELVGLFIPYI